VNTRNTPRTAKLTVSILMALIGITGQISNALAQAATAPSVKPAPTTTQPVQPKTVKDAILAAQKTGKFLFVLFFDQKNDLYKDMEKTLTAFKDKKENSGKLIVYQASASDKMEAEAVAKYGVARAKLPLMMVFAPNGAITGGFPQKVTDRQLEKAMVSDLVAKIVKVLQDRKVALVLLQNSKTKFNLESGRAAEDFSSDAIYKGHVEIIKDDPENPNIKTFLGQSGLNKPISESTIVLITPPGSIVGTYPGNITKDTLLDALAPKTSSCCPGGGGGCK
jgi:hypothetical protein